MTLAVDSGARGMSFSSMSLTNRLAAFLRAVASVVPHETARLRAERAQRAAP
jgi:hypothetical protein